MIIPLHVAALACYAAAALTSFAPFLGVRQELQRVSSSALVIGVLLHGAALYAYTRLYGALPLTGFTPALSVFAFVLGLLAIGGQIWQHGATVTLVLGPILVFAVGLSTLLGVSPSANIERISAAWFVLHVTLSFLGVALLAMAFAASTLYLLEHHELRRRRFGTIFRLFPALEQLDRVNLVALVTGFAILTFGTVLAIRYAVEYRAGRAQVIWGTLTWLVFGATVGLRTLGKWQGRRAALASVAGFVLVVLIYLVLKLATPSLDRFL